MPTELRSRKTRLPLIPVFDLLLLVFAIGTATLTAHVKQRATLAAAIDQEISSQRSFWSTRAQELCAPPAEAPVLTHARDLSGIGRSFDLLRMFRDEVWTSYQACVEERVEVIPEELLRFAFDRADAFDMTLDAVAHAGHRIRSLVDRNRDRRRIFVRGHTDVRGTDEYNYALSMNRAWYVGRIVLAHLQAQRLTAGTDFELIPEGLGESRPVERRAGESDDAWDSRCRRIELAFQRIPHRAQP